MKIDWWPSAVIALCLLVPLAGCVVAVATADLQWLWLLAPLVIFMEGGIALGFLAILVVCLILAGTT